MLRSLWFIAQIAILCVILLWASKNPGDITIHWFGKNFQTDIGMGLASIYVLILICFQIQNISNNISIIPMQMAHKNALKRKDQYLTYITKGLSTLAAGNIKDAEKYSHKAQKIESEKHGLLLLLEAQIAQKQHKNKKASHLLEKLSNDPDAAFLGTRIRIQKAANDGNKEQLQSLTSQAIKEHAHSAWLTQAAYKTAINSHNWQEALTLLDKMNKSNTLPLNDIKNERLALLLTIYDNEEKKKISTLKQAHKINSSFPPLIQRMSRYYLNKNKREQAVKLVKKAWKLAPHPDLAAIWEELIPEKSKGKIVYSLKWAQTLAKQNPLHFESYFFLGNVAYKSSLWGEARGYYLQAKNTNQATQKWYRAMAELERKQDNNEDAAQEWLHQAENNKIDPCWMCIQTNTTYQKWSSLAMPHNSFNTIEWQVPGTNSALTIATKKTEHLTEMISAV